MVGLFFQIVQLAAFGIATANWFDPLLEFFSFAFYSTDRVMWFAGGLAALSSLTYPSISAFVSVYAKDSQQGKKKTKGNCWTDSSHSSANEGLVQGMVNGVRGLCNGLGPALFGFTFYLFNVDLGYSSTHTSTKAYSNSTATLQLNIKSVYSSMLSRDIPGPPFLFGALLVTIALMFSLLLPNSRIEANGMTSDTRTIEQRARLLSHNQNLDHEIQSD